MFTAVIVVCSVVAGGIVGAALVLRVIQKGFRW
jgi:hypothetical protein